MTGISTASFGRDPEIRRPLFTLMVLKYRQKEVLKISMTISQVGIAKKTT
jgi:hypothetical protein